MTQTPRHFQEHGIPSPLSGDPLGSTASESATSEPVVVRNTVGLHARPAAALVNAAKEYASEIRLRRGSRDVNAKSLVSIMSLGVRRGDSVQLSACGPDAIEAVQSLAAFIASGCGVSEAEAVLPPAATVHREPKPAHQVLRMLGTPSAPGLAIGTVFQIRHNEIVIEETAEDPSQERQRLDSAL